MLVFKNAANPCLIGRDVLATHSDTKQHFEALMGSKQTPCISKETPKQSSCNTRHYDRSSDDDYDEMDDKFNDNSATKGCWAKNKTKIDECIQTKVPVSMDRNICKTKVNNSIVKRISTTENVYNCSNDHQCGSNRKEINTVQYPES